MWHYLQVAYTLLIETSSNCKGQLSDKFDWNNSDNWPWGAASPSDVTTTTTVAAHRLWAGRGRLGLKCSSISAARGLRVHYWTAFHCSCSLHCRTIAAENNPNSTLYQTLEIVPNILVPTSQTTHKNSTSYLFKIFWEKINIYCEKQIIYLGRNTTCDQCTGQRSGKSGSRYSDH